MSVPPASSVSIQSEIALVSIYTKRNRISLMGPMSPLSLHTLRSLPTQRVVRPIPLLAPALITVLLITDY